MAAKYDAFASNNIHEVDAMNRKYKAKGMP